MGPRCGWLLTHDSSNSLGPIPFTTGADNSAVNGLRVFAVGINGDVSGFPVFNAVFDDGIDVFRVRNDSIESVQPEEAYYFLVESRVWNLQCMADGDFWMGLGATRPGDIDGIGTRIADGGAVLLPHDRTPFCGYRIRKKSERAV